SMFLPYKVAWNVTGSPSVSFIRCGSGLLLWLALVLLPSIKQLRDSHAFFATGKDDTSQHFFIVSDRSGHHLGPGPEQRENQRPGRAKASCRHLDRSREHRQKRPRQRPR